jgi:hypothetical protein
MQAASTYLTRTLLALTTAACGEPRPATAADVQPENSGTSNTGVSPSTEMPGAEAAVSADSDAPRSGSFRMLVDSRTAGFRHDSITQGKVMLREIALEHGFDITEAETNELITARGSRAVRDRLLHEHDRRHLQSRRGSRLPILFEAAMLEFPAVAGAVRRDHQLL